MKITFSRFTLLLIFVLTQTSIQAQYDTIKYINGTKQAAKIIEINEKVVRFKNPKDTTGPTFTINIKNIEQFILKDGCIDLKDKGYENCVKDPAFDVIKNEDFTRNIISIDLLQLCNAHYQLSYDRIFKNRQFGLAGYFNCGLLDGKDESTYDRIESKLNNEIFYKKKYGGLDLKYYPTLHKRNTLWLALGVEAGMANEKITYDSIAQTNVAGGQPILTANGTYIHSSNTTYVSYYTGPSTVTFASRFFISYHLAVGFLFRINKNFICQGNISAA